MQTTITDMPPQTTLFKPYRKGQQNRFGKEGKEERLTFAVSMSSASFAQDSAEKRI